MGRVWEGLGEGVGLIFGSKMMLGSQSEAGMFKKCLGTFVGSFELMFLDVWGDILKPLARTRLARRIARSA